MYVLWRMECFRCLLTVGLQPGELDAAFTAARHTLTHAVLGCSAGPEPGTKAYQNEYVSTPSLLCPIWAVSGVLGAL